jgi:hypothetical protein
MLWPRSRLVGPGDHHGRFPFSDTDEYRLKHKIRCHEVKYPMGISIEAELIMRRVSIINIKA